MTMGKKSDRRRKARLKKETIGKLEERTLSPDDLGQVAGGKALFTSPCMTMC
jgi:hypothetical protein